MNLASRLEWFGIHSFIGVVTFLPNVMLGDGPSASEYATNFGAGASITFITSGFAGLFNGRYLPIQVAYSLTGLAASFQVIALACSPIIRKMS